MERDWSSFVALAKRLIDKNGRSVNIELLSKGPADANKPWRGNATPATSISTVVKACFVPATTEMFGRTIANDDMLAKTDQIALVAQSTSNLENYTSINDGNSRYKIEWVWTLKPGSVIIMYAFGICR